MNKEPIKRNPIKLIKAAEIRQRYSMQKAINAMEKAFTSLSSGEAFVPARNVFNLPSNGLQMLFKPAHLEEEKRLTIKILSQRNSNINIGIPTIQGIILVLDSESGEIISIMDGEYITALRTGAASGLATRILAHKNARTLAIFGCGAQGKTQLEAVICERKIKKVFVFDINENRALEFVQEMRDKHKLEIEYCTNTSQLADVDIICTATNSNKPLFLKNEVKKGVHINAIGSFRPQMQEIDPLLIKASKVYVDQLEPCLKESGDLIKPISAGIIQEDHIMGEIGEYFLKRIKGRESATDITIFKSVGVAIQDYAVAVDIYNQSVAEGFGMEFNLFE